MPKIKSTAGAASLDINEQRFLYLEALCPCMTDGVRAAIAKKAGLLMYKNCAYCAKKVAV